MSEILWIMGGILALILVIGVVFVWKLRKNNWKHNPDYKTFFTMGIIWLPFGIALNMPYFFIMGLVFIAIGLANKDKWDKKTKMTAKQKKRMLMLTAGGVVMLVAGAAVFLLLV
jgi:NhaP-type Na+/H+ or K+/H+ antiporter